MLQTWNGNGETILPYCRDLLTEAGDHPTSTKLVETICVSGASPNSLEDGASAMHIVVGMHKNRSLEHGQGFAVNRKLYGGDGFHPLKSGVGSFSTEIASYE